jgi:FMN phosphatase YigB (HAD superfamily)
MIKALIFDCFGVLYAYTPTGLVRDEQLISFTQEQRKSYKIALLSNITRSAMDEYVSLQEREQLFDAVVLSAEVMMAKPERAIFELTCRRLGVELSEAVMIDDTPTICRVAKTYGMQSVCYKNFDQCKAELAELMSS